MKKKIRKFRCASCDRMTSDKGIKFILWEKGDDSKIAICAVCNEYRKVMKIKTAQTLAIIGMAIWTHGELKF